MNILVIYKGDIMNAARFNTREEAEKYVENLIHMNLGSKSDFSIIEETSKCEKPKTNVEVQMSIFDFIHEDENEKEDEKDHDSVCVTCSFNYENAKKTVDGILKFLNEYKLPFCFEDGVLHLDLGSIIEDNIVRK